MAYVPPWKRKQQEGAANGVEASPKSSGYTSKELRGKLQSPGSHTFCSSSLDPTKLSHIREHQDANPRESPKDRLQKRTFWTRNSLELIQTHPNVPLPLFTERPFSRSYDFVGWYAITSCTIHEGKSEAVLKFIKTRGESKKSRPSDAWASAVEAKWAEVVVERCNAEVQKERGNPMD